MEKPIIDGELNFLVWGVLLLVVTLGFWADKTKVGSNVSGAAIILCIGMVLSNVGVMPRHATAYGVVWEYLVPLAISLLLLKANVRRVFIETKGMLVAFFLGACGTTVGALIGYSFLDLGSEADKLAGILSATYIGGSMNMVAVTQALDLTPSLVTAAVAADNVVGVIYLALLGIIPSISFLKWWFREKNAPASVGGQLNGDAVHVDLKNTAFALTISLGICALSKLMSAYVGLPAYSIIFVTGFTLLVANIFPQLFKNISGDYEIGLLFMYLFFAAIGLSADVGAMLEHALVIAGYAFIIVACHAVCIFGGSRFFNLKLMEAVIASNACAAGPASAAALAAGKGRQDLVAPAVLLGVFGYAVANFVGVALAMFLSGS
ncbi:MAG: DUF819 domain-containing protein [Kordiimonas sp.]